MGAMYCLSPGRSEKNVHTALLQPLRPTLAMQGTACLHNTCSPNWQVPKSDVRVQSYRKSPYCN